MSAYSFTDVLASLVGPGATIALGAGSGSAEEGIDIELVEDVNTMTGGADGSVMHSLHAGRRGLCVVTLLKTSPTNALLTAAYTFQRLSAANHGQNSVVVTDKARGDVYTNRQVAFKRFPTNKYGKDGNMLAWRFDVGFVDPLLGVGLANLFAA